MHNVEILRRERFQREQDGETMMLKGYAAVFNQPSEDLGGFREMIAPGAFTKTLREKADVRALFNHDSNLVLARSSAGTLKLSEDGFGLLAEIEVAETTVGRDTYELIRRGEIREMSFAFIVVSESFEYWKDDVMRTVLEAKLYDVSPVAFPAYKQTTIALANKRDSYVDILSRWHQQGGHTDTRRLRLALAEVA